MIGFDAKTLEHWQTFNDRISIAETALNQAWERDHKCREAAEYMLNLALWDQRPNDFMDLWFERAMAADPDDRTACNAKFTWLEAHWPATRSETVAFGRELRDTQNWYSDFPFLLVTAHQSLAAHPIGSEDYYANPAVWEDLRSVYETYLSAVPDNAVVRSSYAFFAGRCGQWGVVREQFKLMGSKAVAAQFGGAAEMQKYQKMAAKKAAKAAP